VTSQHKPRLLDLFCGQGGAAAGYVEAGFAVVGVDVVSQPRYPFEFVHADALYALKQLVAGRLRMGRLDAVHASPPCQAYSKAQKLRGNDHPRLIGKVRGLLEETGLPYVIENVERAAPELRGPALLCGTMFGLRLYRHRLFETNWPLTAPLHGGHYLKQVKMGRPAGADEILQPVGHFSGVEEAREAMGMPWATQDGLREAVPPAYTSWIGGQLFAEVERRAVCAA
jgi:DNA (cytosine-5)-methyltransferase 1